MYAYRQAGLLQRLARRTAATRPMAWVYGHIQERTDQWVYRLTRGRATLSSLLSGLPVIMLTTIGARTGEPRTKPVLGIPEGEHLVVVASNFGRRHSPAWYYNLRAHPVASVSAQGKTYEVHAREVSAEERERCFQQAVDIYPGFARYSRWAAHRRIPVIRLDRAD